MNELCVSYTSQVFAVLLLAELLETGRPSFLPSTAGTLTQRFRGHFLRVGRSDHDENMRHLIRL